MGAPRLRRLASDYEMVRAEFSGHPHVHVEPSGPTRPPERYFVRFRLRGIQLEGAQPVPVDEHLVDISLPASYPREQPYCTPLTPLFHPNVKDYFCLQDYWAASQTLVDTIAKIADMIQYRVYNPASPLNALAARWASQHSELFPLGNVMLGTPDFEVAIGSKRAGDAVRRPDPDATALPEVEDGLLAPDALLEGDEDVGVQLRSGG